MVGLPDLDAALAGGTGLLRGAMDLVAEHGGLLHAAAQSEPDGPALVRRAFDLAVARNLDLDQPLQGRGARRTSRHD